MYRQLDIVIDNIASTVLILEAVQSSMNKMNTDELNAFQLDTKLGGTSAVLQRKSIERFAFVLQEGLILVSVLILQFVIKMVSQCHRVLICGNFHMRRIYKFLG